MALARLLFEESRRRWALEPGFQLVEDRHGEVFARLPAQFGALAGDPGFDVIELADPPERLFGDRRLGPLELVEQLSSRMRPAGGMRDARRVAPGGPDWRNSAS